MIRNGHDVFGVIIPKDSHLRRVILFGQRQNLIPGGTIAVAVHLQPRSRAVPFSKQSSLPLIFRAIVGTQIGGPPLVKVRKQGHGALINAMFLMRGSFQIRSEEHTSELQSLMRISYAVFCLKKKKKKDTCKKYT